MGERKSRFPPQSSAQPCSAPGRLLFHLRSLGGLVFQTAFVPISGDGGPGSKSGKSCHGRYTRQNGFCSTVPTEELRWTGRSNLKLLSESNACLYERHGEGKTGGSQECSQPARALPHANLARGSATHRARERKEVGTRLRRSRFSPAPRLRRLTWPRGTTTDTPDGNGKLERKNEANKNPPKSSNTTPAPQSRSRHGNRHRPLRYELKWLRPQPAEGVGGVCVFTSGTIGGARARHPDS